MFDLDKWQEIFSALKKNKLRTFLTAFGVFWGILMLVIMLGSGNGLQNAVFYGMKDFATNSVFMWTQRTTMPYKGLPRGRYFNFRNSDIQGLKDHIPEIEIIAPRIQAGSGPSGSDNVVRNLNSGNFTVNGDFPEWNLIDPVDIVNGRFLNHMDVMEYRKVAVIGDKVYEALFEKDEEPLGQYIRIRGVYFQVIGVFKPKNSNIGFGGDKAQSIFIPFSTLQRTYNYGDIVGWFALTARPDVPASVVEKKAIEYMKRKHSIAPEDDYAIGKVNLDAEFRKVTGLFTGIKVLIWIVGVGTLLAGMIGISNIMLIVVKERTREIGIQRALGATPFKVISQIMTESVFLTAVSGYFGLVLGVFIMEMVNKAMAGAEGSQMVLRNPGIDFNVGLLALSILVLSGLVAGLMPARRAVSIKPIDALRDE
jgi:putative ABC transport system permease protein